MKTIQITEEEWKKATTEVITKINEINPDTLGEALVIHDIMYFINACTPNKERFAEIQQVLNKHYAEEISMKRFK